MTPAMAPLAPIVGILEPPIREQVNQTRSHPAKEIERKVPDVAEGVFDVVPKDKETTRSPGCEKFPREETSMSEKGGVAERR